MKASHVLISMLSLITTGTAAVQACTDFSGHYVNSDEPVTRHLRIHQVGCDWADVDLWHQEVDVHQVVRYLFDGVERITLEDDAVVIKETAEWVGSDMRVMSEIHFKEDGTTHRSVSRTFLDGLGDLWIEEATLDQAGQPGPVESNVFRVRAH